MSISMEALAMAGVDYVEWGREVDEWEMEDSEFPPPPHLLASDSDSNSESLCDGVCELNCAIEESKKRWSMKMVVAAMIVVFIMVERRLMIL